MLQKLYVFIWFLDVYIRQRRLHVGMGHCLVMNDGALSCHGWGIVLSWVGHCLVMGGALSCNGWGIVLQWVGHCLVTGLVSPCNVRDGVTWEIVCVPTDEPDEVLSQSPLAIKSPSLN